MDYLNNSLLLHVLNFVLSPPSASYKKDLRAALSVCKTWRKVLFEGLERIPNKKNVTYKFYFQLEHSKFLSKFKNLKTYFFDEGYDSSNRKKISLLPANLTQLDLNILDDPTWKGISSLISKFTQLKTLSINFAEEPPEKPMSQPIPLPLLQDLTLSGFDWALNVSMFPAGLIRLRLDGMSFPKGSHLSHLTIINLPAHGASSIPSALLIAPKLKKNRCRRRPRR